MPLAASPTSMLWWDPTATSTRTFSILMDGPLETPEGGPIKLLVDGPYREELCLGKYETVMFVAQGWGLSRLMPHLLHLTTRLAKDSNARDRKYRWGIDGLFNDKTRKIDLYWEMDDNSQIASVHNYFKELADLGADSRIQAWVFYPQGIPDDTLLPQANTKRHWFPADGDFIKRVSPAIEIQSRRTPGRTIVVFMDKDKLLPPTPLAPGKRRLSGSYSPETYARLLEEENYQLRLRNHQVMKEKEELQVRMGQQEHQFAATSRRLEEYRMELKRRNENIAELGVVIAAAFRQYGDSSEKIEEDGEIPICYSYFDDDSSPDRHS
ncbi:37S ribosomal protein SWS2 [Purpureocillium lavendulum]|uniref:37S ribosomal protein SWS2 n=1 Tax=Purpureocillium lavendulum TaxID=1247861 RepID=A0AB34FFD8_9HYPO|nr:37S ribosomal protein SWS2 [Purpureocillium lavendulum]